MGTNSFGSYIRAVRLGYRYVERLRAFVRMSGDGPFLVEAVRDVKDMRPLKGKFHRAWWEGPKAEDHVFELSPALARLRPEDVPVQLILDDAGEVVR